MRMKILNKILIFKKIENYYINYLDKDLEMCAEKSNDKLKKITDLLILNCIRTFFGSL